MNKKTLLTTTLALLRDHGACVDGFRKLRNHVGLKWADDAPINLLTVLASNGLDDTLWCLRATIQNSDRVARLFAADCAEDVLPLFLAVMPDDDRPRLAIEAARAYARGEIDDAARAAAGAAAIAAARAAKTRQETMLRRYLAPDRTVSK